MCDKKRVRSSHANVLDKEATTAMAEALVMAMRRGYWHGPVLSSF